MCKVYTKEEIQQEIEKEKQIELFEEQIDVHIELPKTRGDCPGYRPCIFARCVYHLKFDVSVLGHLIDNFPGVEVEDMEQTCCLDLADEGPMSQRKVSRATRIPQKEVEEIEEKTMMEIQEKHPELYDLLID